MNVLSDAAEKLKYCFNEEMVAEWRMQVQFEKDSQYMYEDFEKFVFRNQQMLKSSNLRRLD